MNLIPVPRAPCPSLTFSLALSLIHCHSSTASRQNRRHATSSRPAATLSMPPRLVRYGRTYLRELAGVAAFLSCRHSRQNSSCMAATPTLLTRRGRQRDTSASAACKAMPVRGCTYERTALRGCVRERVLVRARAYAFAYAWRVIKIVCGIKSDCIRTSAPPPRVRVPRVIEFFMRLIRCDQVPSARPISLDVSR